VVWGGISIRKQKNREIKGLVVLSWVRGLTSVCVYIYGAQSASAGHSPHWSQTTGS